MARSHDVSGNIRPIRALPATADVLDLLTVALYSNGLPRKPLLSQNSYLPKRSTA